MTTSSSVGRWWRVGAMAAVMVAGRAFAMSVETYDEKTSTGVITAIEGDALVLKPKASDPATKSIPLQDIVAINLTWQDRQAHISAPAPTTKPATTRKAQPKWRVDVGPGDHVIAELADWNEGGLALTLDNDAHLKVPTEQIRAIWSSVAFQVKKAKDLHVTPQAQDVAFVEKDGDVKAVQGLAVGIDAGELRFKFEGEERKITLERLVGLMLAQRETPAEKSLYATFNLVNGDVLSGKLQGFADGTFQVLPLAGDAAIPISMGLISKVEIHNGRMVSMTDMTPSSVSQASFFDRLMPFQVNQSLTGGPLVMAEGSVAKGIAVHSRCVLTYDLDAPYERFKGKIGFQQPDGKLGRAACRIVGDGKVLWEDADLHGDAKSTPLDLSVEGVKQLTLEVDYGKDQDVGDRVIWAEPRLIKPSASK